MTGNHNSQKHKEDIFLICAGKIRATSGKAVNSNISQSCLLLSEIQWECKNYLETGSQDKLSDTISCCFTTWNMTFTLQWAPVNMSDHFQIVTEAEEDFNAYLLQDRVVDAETWLWGKVLIWNETNANLVPFGHLRARSRLRATPATQHHSSIRFLHFHIIIPERDEGTLFIDSQLTVNFQVRALVIIVWLSRVMF